MDYYISTIIEETFERAIELVTDELKKHNFGIITEIDIKSTFKKKIDVDFKKYTILGACNPNFAHNALLAEDKVGLLLPCNIIVQETGDGKTEIAAIDPAAIMHGADNPVLSDLASDVQDKMKRVIEAL